MRRSASSAPAAVAGRHMGHVWRRGGRVLLSAVAGVLLALAFGCHTAAPTTMTIDDYRLIATDIAENLSRDLSVGFLSDRTADSPLMVMSFQKVTNYTTDIMSTGAKSYLICAVVRSLPKSFLHEKNIQLVATEEHLRAAKRRGTIDWDVGQDRAPTHTMTAIFRSAARLAGKAGRTDNYLCTYEIIDLHSGEIIYNGQTEFSRWAGGRSFD